MTSEEYKITNNETKKNISQSRIFIFNLQHRQ